MIRVGLVGGRGYVGAELIELMDRHPEFEIVFVGSSSLAGQSVSDNIDRELETELKFQELDPESMVKENVDVWVLAQGNGQAKQWVDDLKSGNSRFLDISYDYRFDDNWVYGLPEKNRQAIKGAMLVSNPGCYATATQLALLPILDQIGGTPTAFGVSGYSGAGKKPSDRNDPNRLEGNLLPYALVGHGHELEISHQLGLPVNFVPHVASFFRGISVTVNVPLKDPLTEESVYQKYQDFYSDEPFVVVAKAIPEVVDVQKTPNGILGGFAVDASGMRLVIVSVIDNLLKGAASQALQNLNLMFGFEETTGLVSDV